MAAGSTEVLQEYLVKLGYTIDTVSQKRLTDGLSATGKRVMDVGKGVAGVVVAVEAATAAFAYSMRKAYFAADLAGTSMKKMEAVGYASAQIGISSEVMAGSLQSMAQALRMNPGLKAYIESFGVKVQGRDISDVMQDMVQATRNMPEWQGAQTMGMFGMSPDQYHLMRENMDKFKDKQKESLELQRSMGLDTDRAAESMVHYTGTLDKLGAQLKILGQQSMITYAPFFDKLANVASGTITALTKMANQSTSDVEKAQAANTKPGNAGQVMQKLQSMGWTKEQAAGIAANLQAESGFNPAQPGDYNKNTRQYEAYGVAQWHPDRQAEFRKFSGKDIRGSTLDEQLSFLNYELTKGNEQKAGIALRGATTAGEAGSIVSRMYERPADIEGQASIRAAMASRLGAGGNTTTNVSQTNNITVSGESGGGGDRFALSKAIVRETSRAFADLTRNMGRNQQ
jgi:Phage tail lysozyme